MYKCLLDGCLLSKDSCISSNLLAVTLQAGVAMASAAELSFNWSGFISAMVSNLTFGFRAVWSKK